jgi:hypothetical protein
MKADSAASPTEPEKPDSHARPLTRFSDAPQLRRRHLRLSPIVAIAVAAAGLALVFGLDSDRLGFLLGNPPAVSPEEAVDISLQRLMRTRVAERLRKAHRLDASPQRNRETIDDELGRIRVHPLYAVIKEKMAEHLRNDGYERITINLAPGPKDPMLSLEAETMLNRFIHALRASLPAPNEKLAAFLKDRERFFGKSIVEHRAGDRYDVAFTFLIQLLFDYPDDIEPVASAISFFSRSSLEIEQSLRGGS